MRYKILILLIILLFLLPSYVSATQSMIDVIDDKHASNGYGGCFYFIHTKHMGDIPIDRASAYFSLNINDTVNITWDETWNDPLLNTPDVNIIKIE